jgi:hypothetical protein
LLPFQAVPPVPTPNAVWYAPVLKVNCLQAEELVDQYQGCCKNPTELIEFSAEFPTLKFAVENAQKVVGQAVDAEASLGLTSPSISAMHTRRIGRHPVLESRLFQAEPNLIWLG